MKTKSSSIDQTNSTVNALAINTLYAFLCLEKTSTDCQHLAAKLLPVNPILLTTVKYMGKIKQVNKSNYVFVLKQKKIFIL